MDAITAQAVELSHLGCIRLAAYPFTDDVPFASERGAGAAKEQRMIAADSFNTPFGGERCAGRALSFISRHALLQIIIPRQRTSRPRRNSLAAHERYRENVRFSAVEDHG